MSVTDLKGNFRAIQLILSMSDGKFMVMVVPTDFVCMFDVKS